jgi:hypothetical protein
LTYMGLWWYETTNSYSELGVGMCCQFQVSTTLTRRKELLVSTGQKNKWSPGTVLKREKFVHNLTSITLPSSP